MEYACATTNVQRYSVGEKMEVIPNTFKEAMTLPAKAHWKAASDKEVASLKKEQRIHPRAGNRRSSRPQDRRLSLGVQGQG